jgi:hypothetical protein
MLPVTSGTPGLFRADACDAQTCRKAFLFTFDNQTPTMRGYKGQVTRTGYDNMTGIGTPRGQVFISALRKLEG